MQIRGVLINMAAAVMTTAAAAQAAGPDVPADSVAAALRACLAEPENETTSGMLNCTDAAYKAYDAELNIVYGEVMAKLDPHSKNLVRESQRRWLAFRKAEAAAMAGPWTQDRGSVVSLDIAAAAVDAIKERIRELRLYE